MKEAILKAIEGGWWYGNLKSEYKGEHDGLYMFVCEIASPQIRTVSASEIREDARFWQCLGKALGWKGEHMFLTFENQEYSQEDEEKEIDKIENEETRNYQPMWLYHWHRFVDWIAEGKDVDEFFKELLKPNTIRR